MPRTSKKSKKPKVPSQGVIYLYEPDDTEGEETATISMLIHAALILELAEMIKSGEVELTERGQVKFGGRLYESEDSDYFESGMVWTREISRDDWPEVLEDFEDIELEKPSRSRKSSRSSGKSERRTRGQTRSRR